MKLAALTLLGSLVAAGVAFPAEPLTVRVSPAVAAAPANIVVSAAIEPSHANRRLVVDVESDLYQRTSEMTLDGERAQRLNTFSLKGLPSGLYEVRVSLMGEVGTRASKLLLVRVERGAGQ
jgi:hypothetical protein